MINQITDRHCWQYIHRKYVTDLDKFLETKQIEDRPLIMLHLYLMGSTYLYKESSLDHLKHYD